MLDSGTVKFYNIDSRSWEHPADRAALNALRGVKGLKEVSDFVFGNTTEQSLRLLHLASTVRVTKNQYPSIYDKIQKITEIFDWPKMPEVFVKQSPTFNAYTYGMKDPFIVINSALVDSLDEKEIMCVLAHEMGHIMSGHATYKTLISLLADLSKSITDAKTLVIMPIVAALREWDRKSELTADRASLLAVQDKDIVFKVLMKMAGGVDPTQLNMNDFFAQAQEYEDAKDIGDTVFKFFNTVFESHPYPVVRLKELYTWTSSGEFQKIMNGDFMKRDFAKADPIEEIKNIFDFYKPDVKASSLDDLKKFFSSYKPQSSNAGQTFETMKKIFEQGINGNSNPIDDLKNFFDSARKSAPEHEEKKNPDPVEEMNKFFDEEKQKENRGFSNDDISEGLKNLGNEFGKAAETLNEFFKNMQK